jgi:hypothetical protein
MIDPVVLSTLDGVQRRLLWLAVRMVDAANHDRPRSDGPKVGGHQASSASMVTIMTALWFHHLRAEDRVSVKPSAERAAPIVTVHDASTHAMAWLGSVFGAPVVPLGVDGFGQSGSLTELYRDHDLLSGAVVNAALLALERAVPDVVHHRSSSLRDPPTAEAGESHAGIVRLPFPPPSAIPPAVMIDIARRSRMRDLAAITGAVLLTAACAQVIIPLPGRRYQLRARRSPSSSPRRPSDRCAALAHKRCTSSSAWPCRCTGWCPSSSAIC